MSDRDLMTAVVRGWHEQHLRAKARGVQGRAATPTPVLTTPRVGVGKGRGVGMAKVPNPALLFS